MPTEDARKVLAWGIVLISSLVLIFLCGVGLYTIHPNVLLVVSVLVGCALWVWALSWAMDELFVKKR